MLPVSKLLKRYRKIIADRIDLLFKLLVVRIKMMFSHVFFFFTATIQVSTSSLSKEFLVPKTISQFGITGNQFKLNTGVKIECIKSHHQMAVDGGKQSAECVFLTFQVHNHSQGGNCGTNNPVLHSSVVSLDCQYAAFLSCQYAGCPLHKVSQEAVKLP